LAIKAVNNIFSTSDGHLYEALKMAGWSAIKAKKVLFILFYPSLYPFGQDGFPFIVKSSGRMMPKTLMKPEFS